MRYFTGLLAFIFFVTPSSVFAAKIDSIAGKSVTIFLQTLDDEDIQVGNLIYLTDKSGKRKVTLKVTNNRGVMADTKVISGAPKKSYKVLMPHQVKSRPATRKIAKPKPKQKLKKRVVVKKPKLPPVVSKPPPIPAKPDRRVKKATTPKVTKEPTIVDDVEPTSDSALSFELDQDDEDDDIDTPEPNSTSRIPYRWNISMDILSLAGLVYDYQVFSFMAERRVSHGLAIGLSFNFGTFESNEGLNVTDKPLVRRSEYGVFGRYNFSGDTHESGMYTSLAFKAASENWVATQNFSEATDGGSVAALTVGYQYILRTLTLRAGYAFQYSTLPENAEFESVTHVRTQALMTGMAHYAVIQFGILF